MARSTRTAGFTLIELMISVCIVGILSALSIPILVQYIQKAKSGEARELLHRIYVSARVYYLEERTKPGQIQPLPRQFPDPEPLTPAVSCCMLGGAKCAPSAAYWNTPSWQALTFSVDDPHYYRYGFITSGSGIGAQFITDAVGDLDCDGLTSTFSMMGAVMSSGEVSGSAGISKFRDLE